MKKYVLIIITLTLTLILSIIFFDNNKTNMKNYIEIKNAKQEILQYNIEDIDIEFLDWIEETYGEYTLIKLENKLEENTYDKKIWHDLTGNSLIVLKDLYSNNKSDNIKIINGNKEEITLSFIGDVSLADNFEIIPYYDSRGGITGILSEEVIDNMQSSDLLIANNEFTISNRGEKMPNKLYTFRALPERVNIYKEMGVDLVTLANNHVYDFGQLAFLDTLEILKENDIPYIGAGQDINEAIKPYYFIINGYKIGFVNATRAEKYIMTPEASESSPGVLRTYNPEKFKEVIKNTKSNSDYVIALIHWGKEDSHQLEQVQIDTGKEYIDSGADVLVGTHAHVLQGMEFYNDKLIAYNLGDFIFNRESKETGILNVKINSSGELKYQFIPCYQHDYKTTLLKDEEKTITLDNMEKWSVNAKFNDNGDIEKK